MGKEKSCVICGETELKRYRVVTGENVRPWSQLVRSTLYPGQRICGSHVPPGWKKKVAKIEAAAGDDENGDLQTLLPPPNPLLSLPPPLPVPNRTPSWEHHHQNPSANPNNSGSYLPSLSLSLSSPLFFFFFLSLEWNSLSLFAKDYLFLFIQKHYLISLFLLIELPSYS